MKKILLVVAFSGVVTLVAGWNYLQNIEKVYGLVMLSIAALECAFVYNQPVDCTFTPAYWMTCSCTNVLVIVAQQEMWIGLLIWLLACSAAFGALAAHHCA